MWAECSAAASGKEVALHLAQPQVAAPGLWAFTGSERREGKCIKYDLVERGNPRTRGRLVVGGRPTGTLCKILMDEALRRLGQGFFRVLRRIERLGFKAAAREVELGSSGGSSEEMRLEGICHRALTERALVCGQCQAAYFARGLLGECRLTGVGFMPPSGSLHPCVKLGGWSTRLRDAWSLEPTPAGAHMLLAAEWQTEPEEVMPGVGEQAGVRALAHPALGCIGRPDEGAASPIDGPAGSTHLRPCTRPGGRCMSAPRVSHLGLALLSRAQSRDSLVSGIQEHKDMEALRRGPIRKAPGPRRRSSKIPLRVQTQLALRRPGNLWKSTINRPLANG